MCQKFCIKNFGGWVDGGKMVSLFNEVHVKNNQNKCNPFFERRWKLSRKARASCKFWSPIHDFTKPDWMAARSKA